MLPYDSDWSRDREADQHQQLLALDSIQLCQGHLFASTTATTNSLEDAHFLEHDKNSTSGMSHLQFLHYRSTTKLLTTV